MSEYAKCPQCGSMYLRDEGWKRVCIDCWKRNKRSDTTIKIDANELQKIKAERDYWRDQYGRLQNTQRATPKDNHIAAQIKSIVMDIIFLTHPDKHGNSQKSNDITARLIEIRKELLA